MSAQTPRSAGSSRSTRRMVLDVFLIFAIPSFLIYLISIVWK